MQTLTSARFSGIGSGIACFLVATLLGQSAMVHAQSAPAPASPSEAAEETPEPTDATEPTPDDAAAPAEEVPLTEEAPSEEVGSAPPPAVTAAPLAEVAPVTAAPPSHTASYVLWGLGGASLVAGTVFGVLALTAESDFDDNPTTSGADKTHNLAIGADVALGLGLILGITGTVYYFSKDEPLEQATAARSSKEKRALSDVRVAPFVSPRATGGALSLRF